MAKSRKELIEIVVGQLNRLQLAAKLNTGIRRFDFMKDLENVYRNVFNILHDWELENVNKSDRNLAAFDLIDYENRVGIQIALEASSIKIRETIDAFQRFEGKEGYRLIIFSVLEETKKRKRHIQTDGDYTFDLEHDLWDHTTLYEKVRVCDTKTLGRLCTYLERISDQNKKEGEVNVPIPIHCRGYIHTPKELNELVNVVKKQDIAVAWGDAGSGKTELAIELANVYVDAGQQVFWGRFKESIAHTIESIFKSTTTLEESVELLSSYNGKCLLIVDDAPDDPEKLNQAIKEMQTLFTSSGMKIHVLILTRCRTEGYHVNTDYLKKNLWWLFEELWLNDTLWENAISCLLIPEDGIVESVFQEITGIDHEIFQKLEKNNIIRASENGILTIRTEAREFLKNIDKFPERRKFVQEKFAKVYSELFVCMNEKEEFLDEYAKNVADILLLLREYLDEHYFALSFQAADIYMRNAIYENAIVVYEELLSKVTEEVDAYWQINLSLVVAYQKMENYEKARSICEELILFREKSKNSEKELLDADLWELYGDIWMDLNDPQAIAAYRNAIKVRENQLVPNQPKIHDLQEKILWCEHQLNNFGSGTEQLKINLELLSKSRGLEAPTEFMGSLDILEFLQQNIEQNKEQGSSELLNRMLAYRKQLDNSFLKEESDVLNEAAREEFIRVQSNEAKVIFLGDGGVGKTYTVKRLLNHGEPEQDGKAYETKRTHGIFIRKHEVDIDYKRKVSLHLWDFGGQAILHAMHRIFMTKQTCYVVMINTCADQNHMSRVRYWLNNIVTLAPDAKVLLLVNRWDNMHDRLDRKTLQEEYPNNLVKIMELDVKTDSKEQFMQLEKVLVQMTETITSRYLPKSWMKLRSRLLEEGRKENGFAITEEDYNQWCLECGIDEFIDSEERGSVREQLLHWLQSIGTCFSYSEMQEEGNQLIVLNPEWITNAIYMLVVANNAEEPVTTDGVLKENIIARILKDPEMGESGDLDIIKNWKYSKEQSKYILGVMRKYELSYPVKEGEFIPALCSAEPSEEIRYQLTAKAKQEKPPKASYRIEYPFLPDSVFYQMMCHWKNQHQIDDCWNRGMKIGIEAFQLEAYIYGRPDEDCLYVDVYADDENQHEAWELLQPIRDNISRINENLDLQGMDYVLARETEAEIPFKIESLEYWSKQNEPYFLGLKERHDIRQLLKTIYGNVDLGTRDAAGFEGDFAFQEEARRNLYRKIFNPELQEGLYRTMMAALQRVVIEIKNPLEKEDVINDRVRNYISMVYKETLDQTRQGESESREGKGELDLLIRKDNFQLAIAEALRMETVFSKGKTNLRKHIHKMLDNYDPLGLPYGFVLMYVRDDEEEKVSFDEFWRECTDYLQKFSYPEGCRREGELIAESPYGTICHASQTIIKWNKPEVVHYMAVYLRKTPQEA